MKKQELIKHIEDLPYKEGPIVDKIDISRKGLLELVEQLDEPKKVVVQQFVADWIEEARKSCKDVADLFDFDFTNEEVGKWFMQERPFDLVARAWLDGYEVEEEKKYKITLLNRNDGDLYLINQNADLADKYGHFSPVVLLFTKCTNFSEKCYKLTKKEVVSYDFGWVFDCPGVQIEEVE